MKYGFIGCGNIATAIIKGVLRSGHYQTHELLVYDANGDMQNQFVDRYGVGGCKSLEGLAEIADVIFVAVKPNVYALVLPLLKQALDARSTMPTVVSIATGQTLAYVRGILGEGAPLIRVMPNLNAEMCAGFTALCACDNVSHEQKQVVLDFFNATGMTTEMEESMISVCTSISGCSPAFTYLFIDSLAKGAMKNGMNKKLAIQIAAQTVLGSAQMILESDAHPWELIDKVCSPGGVTIEGLCTLGDYGFESAIVHAIDSIVNKDKKIGG